MRFQRVQQVAAAGTLDSSTWTSNEPGVEVLLQVKTSSSNAQLQLDHLQRSSQNTELQSSLGSHGALLGTQSLWRPFGVPVV